MAPLSLLFSANVPRCTPCITSPADGWPYLLLKPDKWVSGAFYLVDSSGCQPAKVPEFSTLPSGALQFEFRAPALGACGLDFTMSKWAPCGSNRSSTAAISRFIDTGMISATVWRNVTIPIAFLQDNGGLQCGTNASWNLARQHYLVTLSLCNSCSTTNGVCHVRNMRLLSALPASTNKVPIISGVIANMTVPRGGTVKLPGAVTDDGLPAGSTVTASWSVASAPAGFQPSHMMLTPHSAAARAAWGTFSSSAPAGTYVLQLTASDGQYSATANVTVEHLGWPVALAFVKPVASVMPGEAAYVSALGVLPVVVNLNLSSSLTSTDYISFSVACSDAAANGAASCSAGAVTVTIANGSITAAAAATLPGTGTFILTFTAVVTTGAAGAGFPAVTQTSRQVVVVVPGAVATRPVAWQPGQRIPASATAPNTAPWMGSATLPDRIWRPLLQATAEAVITTSGTWSALRAQDPDGLLSRPGACVVIPQGVAVEYDVCDAAPITLRCLVVLGKLSFSASTSTCLRVGTLQLHDGAQLAAGPPAPGVVTNVTFSAPAINPVEDPDAQTVGLVAYHADVGLAGTPRCGLRLTGSGMAAGAATIKVPGAAGCWQAGDVVALPDTQVGLDICSWKWGIPGYAPGNYNPQTEYRTVADVADDGSVRLDLPLAFNHSDVPLALLTRSLTLRSDVAGGGVRAHVMCTGYGRFELSHVAVLDTGRTSVDFTDDTVFDADGNALHIGTNIRGRYGVHSHKLRRPVVWTGVVVGASSPNAPLARHGLVLHDSHGTLINNTVIGAAGSGVFIEDGTETGIVTGTLVVGTGAGSRGSDDSRFASSSGRDMGHGGHGIWSRGPLIRIVDNAAIGVFQVSGFSYYNHCTFRFSLTVPTVEGVNDGLRGRNLPQCSTPLNAYGAFENNTVFGTFQQGLLHGYGHPPTGAPQTFTNFRATATALSGASVLTIHSTEVTLVAPSLTAVAPGNRAQGVYYNNGVSTIMRVLGGSITGYGYGVSTFPLGTLLVNTTVASLVHDVSFASYADGRVAAGSGLAVLRSYAGSPTLALSYNVSAVGAVPLPAGMKSDGVAFVAGGPSYL